eukprot:c15515_g1_i1 orf=402-962(-)
MPICNCHKNHKIHENIEQNKHLQKGLREDRDRCRTLTKLKYYSGHLILEKSTHINYTTYNNNQSKFPFGLKVKSKNRIEISIRITPEENITQPYYVERTLFNKAPSSHKPARNTMQVALANIAVSNSELTKKSRAPIQLLWIPQHNYHRVPTKKHLAYKPIFIDRFCLPLPLACFWNLCPHFLYIL